MASDLVASLRPWPIEDIQIGDRVFRIPEMAAADWLILLLPEDISLWSIVPGLLQPDASEHVEEIILGGGLGRDEWEELTWDIVSIAGGRDWWTVLYLLGNAKHYMNADIVRSQLALHGVDATKISLSAWLDAVYGILAPPGIKPEDRARIDAMLRRPPPGVKPKIDRDAQRAAFAQLMASE